jgi:hypothetical protein
MFAHQCRIQYVIILHLIHNHELGSKFPNKVMTILIKLKILKDCLHFVRLLLNTDISTATNR